MTSDSAPFDLYAAVYDLLYADKDYPGEARFVSELIGRFGARGSAPVRVIDLACGTARHALELARQGFDVTGCDVSPRMIAIARAAAARAGLHVPFHVEAFQTCDRVGGQYDVALALFASLGYVLSDDEFQRSLANIHSLLVPGGLFIFDVWNATAVAADYSPRRERHACNEAMSVTRVSRTSLDERLQVATVHFDVDINDAGGKHATFSERHDVRFYDVSELNRKLQTSGYDVLLTCPFMDPSRQVDRSDWNMTLVARAR